MATIPYLNDNGMMSQMVGYYKLSEVTDEPEMVLRAGWYAMDQNTITFNNRITVAGEVHFILVDGTILRPKQGICVPYGSTFHVWAQSESTLVGQLNVSNTNMPEDGNMAGIGGNFNEPGGSIHIHGGSMVVNGKGTGAGIGGGGGYGGGGFQSIIISNGGIMALGDQDYEVGGAGIGGGACNVAPDITITGGQVISYGGDNGAGIGSGCGGLNHIVTDPTTTGPTTTSIIRTIHITGGEVTAYGIGNGAGIGGGGGYVGGYWGGATGLAWDGNSSNIFIDGGKVLAMHYLDDDVSNGQAIGHGHNMPSEQYFPEARIYPGAKVRVKTTIESAAPYTILGKNDRLNALGKDVNSHYKLVIIEPCDHPSATNYTDNNNGTYTTDCAYCTGTNLPHICTHDGNWNDGASWQSGHVPNGGQDVVLWASATIPSGYTANAANVTLNGSGDGTLTLTIADGGQLLHTNEGVVATVQKSISGHSNGSNGGWYFIASPLTESFTPTAGNGFLTNTYDLYFYDEPTHYWRNYKPSNNSLSPNFSIEPQKGYLYANSSGTTLSMTGTLRPSNKAFTIDNLSYTSTAATLSGWNLVGNPFACNATIDKPCYTISGTAINTTANGANVYQIAPCEAVMVQADATNESVTFTRVDPASQASHPNNGNMQIMLTQANTRSAEQIDNAIVSFNEGEQLGKFYFGEQNANIYIPQDGKEYAIVSVGGDVARYVSTEIPVNFKANQNGQYTISVNPEGVEMGYLHLIDNMTGADIDLLQTSDYSFEASTTDYESRFRLVFSAMDGPSTGSGTFAFISDGQIIITDAEADATLQVVDMTGRVIISRDVARNVSTAGMTPGMYVLRLINGDDVKTQKIIIK